MKLTDISRKPSYKRLNKLSESRFGISIDYDSLTYKKAEKLSKQIFETVTKIRHSGAVHTAERNPKYLEMLVVYEGLQSWMDDHRSRFLTEDEVGQAETILAAKSLVDTVQDMIQKAGKMQNEELPALIDSIRDQIGDDRAEQFRTSVGTAVGELVAFLTQSREKLDNGVRGLTGESVDQAMDTGLDDDFDDDTPDLDDEGDGFDATDAAAGGSNPLGRERR